MDTLIKAIPLFWTFAEGLILLAVRWGYLCLRKEKGRQPLFWIFCIMAFFFLMLFRFGGKALFGHFFDLKNAADLLFYKRASWNFFCTVWVILEGAIMVYVLRIYDLMKMSMGEKRGKSNRGTRSCAPAIFILVGSLACLYGFYEGFLWSLKTNHGLGMNSIHHISIFYVRICGIFWIAFEWVVAVMGFKTYFLLKRNRARLKWSS